MSEEEEVCPKCNNRGWVWTAMGEDVMECGCTMEEDTR